MIIYKLELLEVSIEGYCWFYAISSSTSLDDISHKKAKLISQYESDKRNVINSISHSYDEYSNYRFIIEVDNE